MSRIAASAVTKNPSVFSRAISASASRITASTRPDWRSAVLLQSALLTAMKRLLGSPFPDTSPMRKKIRSWSKAKKSYRSPPTSRAGSRNA